MDSVRQHFNLAPLAQPSEEPIMRGTKSTGSIESATNQPVPGQDNLVAALNDF